MNAWIFPGQGSQFPGMAAGLGQGRARAAWDVASDVLGWDVRSVCAQGPADALSETRVAQPAILTASVAAAWALEELGLSPAAVGGHSLGEFSALVVARSLSLEDAVRVVGVRAEAMARAGARRDGGMAAIIGLRRATVETLCARTPGVVVVANVNTAEQLVVSGEAHAVTAVAEAARRSGARRVVPLSVSVAAHSPLMEEAVPALERALAAATIRTPVVPFASSRTGTFIAEPAEIAASLASALTAPVDWPACVGTLAAAGVTGFVEVGPGAVLSGLVRRIIPEVAISAAGDGPSAAALAGRLSTGAAR